MSCWKSCCETGGDSGRGFTTRHTSLRRAIYCSERCTQVAWTRKNSEKRASQRARYTKKQGFLLREHQDAVAAHCRDCEPLGLCRDAECHLRGVSPLPFVPLSAVSTRRKAA